MIKSKVVNAYVFEGLGNRFNCLASALSVGWPVNLKWSVNQHCPNPFEDVFKDIEEVTAFNEPGAGYGYSKTTGYVGWFFASNPGGFEEQEYATRMKSAYRRVFDSIKPETHIFEEDFAALVFRKPLQNTTEQMYVDEVEKMLRIQGLNKVFLICGHRESSNKLMQLFNNKGIEVIGRSDPCMESDLDRQPDKNLEYLANIKSVRNAKIGIVNYKIATGLDILRGFDTPVFYVNDNKKLAPRGIEDMWISRSIIPDDDDLFLRTI